MELWIMLVGAALVGFAIAAVGSALPEHRRRKREEKAVAAAALAAQDELVKVGADG